jgi:immune inhibitor A
MARDAAVLCDPDVVFSKYDYDNVLFVDAFVVIHAGSGAEVNDNPNDIWSHKWLLQGGPHVSDRGTKVYSYLTVPENCRLGVCAHELGHLLFGFPDLYDADYSSEGVGDWCLMGGGSWNNGGLTPAHPSSWCKCHQGWVKTKTPKTNSKNVVVADVKDAKTVYKLWKDGNPGKEYFLIENRQKSKFDKHLPSSGLLIWHINENITSNEDEKRYRVTLIQADGKKHLEKGKNRGDAGDCYPGTLNNKDFDHTSKPPSLSHAGKDTTVALNNIRKSGNKITVDIKVK